MCGVARISSGLAPLSLPTFSAAFFFQTPHSEHHLHPSFRQQHLDIPPTEEERVAVPSIAPAAAFSTPSHASPSSFPLDAETAERSAPTRDAPISLCSSPGIGEHSVAAASDANRGDTLPPPPCAHDLWLAPLTRKEGAEDGSLCTQSADPITRRERFTRRESWDGTCAGARRRRLTRFARQFAAERVAGIAPIEWATITTCPSHSSG